MDRFTMCPYTDKVDFIYLLDAVVSRKQKLIKLLIKRH